jgi:DNA-binding transcriptional LysR family regulator
MDDSRDDIHVLLAVAETGSFSAAARTLQVGQATVSRRVALLEERIGKPLFERGRHGATPTEAALALLPAARETARWAGEFERIAAGQDASIAGTVRIAAPPGVAVEVLAPFAGVLAGTLPEIRLEIIAGIEHIDLLRGGADLAIRLRPPLEPELVALADLEMPLGAWATREYAQRVAERTSGRPGWADLDWICWAGLHRDLPPRPFLERVVPDFRPVFASDDYLVQLEALREGLGCMILAAPDARRRDARRLVRLDVGVDLPPACYHLVSTRSGRLIARVQAVADRLSEWIRAGVAPAPTEEG